VRDHGRLLADQLEREGIPCSRHWLERTSPTLRGAVSEARAWGSALPGQIRDDGAEAVVVHYSCFASAYRGLPVLARPLAGAIRRSGLPTVAVMHELFYPFGRDGVRGAVWASTQRLALLELVLAIDAAVATTEERRDWLTRAWWLPRRPAGFAPVFSNLPPPSAGRPGGDGAPAPGPPVIGMFGYHYDGSGEFVLRALARLAEQGQAPELRLIGSPGPDSRAGQAWISRSRELGVDRHIVFTGLLDPQPLSDALASVELLLFVDPPGPTSRKGTLAGSLASGTPVLALDGPATWPDVRREGALRIVPRDDAALAEGIVSLLGDPGARAELGARGRAFAETAMGVGRTAAEVRRLLALLSAPRAGRAAPA
jgi:glycosyltransferase involved in cell wall biosynthesis